MNIPPSAFGWVWSAWGLIWIVAAFRSARVRVHQNLPDRLLNIVPVVAGGVLLFATPSAGSWLARGVLPWSGWMLTAGLVGTVLGLAFAVWARATLGMMWSGRVTLKDDHALVDRGPYAMARHPIYTGLVLALCATALARNSAMAWLGTLLVIAGLIIKLKQEERLLEGHFGAQYADYRSRVKGLIPWVW